MPFETISREDRLNEEVVQTLARMGCYRLWIGAESGSQRVLDAMKRRTDAERVKAMVHMLQRHGIEVGMFIMLGYEGEERSDLEATVAHLKAAGPDTFLTTVAYPIKGTPYYASVEDRVVAAAGVGPGLRSRPDGARPPLGSLLPVRHALDGQRGRPQPPQSRTGQRARAWGTHLSAHGQDLHERPVRPPGHAAHRTRAGNGVVAQALVSRAAFDEVADRYDDDFTSTQLGWLLRRRVWKYLQSTFPPGARVLEIGCGTGEDAVWLAQRGVSVLATDVSAAMLRTTAAKVEAAGLATRVQVAQLDARAPVLTAEGEFDGAFTNFGGLNCVPDRRRFAHWLGSQVQAGRQAGDGGHGPVLRLGDRLLSCKGGSRPRHAQSPTVAAWRHVGSARLPVWYPSPRTLAADFGPWFSVVRPATGIGSLLPPSYLARLVERFPGVFKTFANLEPRMPLSAWWADHYLTVFERR